MIEDVLTHDERLRLECLVLANSTSHGLYDEEVIAKAMRFETYIKTGANNGR